MTFTRQLHTARGALALAAGIPVTAAVLDLLGPHPASLAFTLPFLAVLGWLTHILCRLLAQQTRLATPAQQLRDRARTIPPGTDRWYTSTVTEDTVHCRPVRGRDDFSLLDSSDLAMADHAEAGKVVHLPVVTYRVSRSAPLVWRQVWVDQAVITGQGMPRTVPRPAAGLAAAFKVLRLNHRTGVLAPDREELERVLRLVQGADHVRDVPREQP